MLDNGYSLVEFEILNWGNFYGYQKIPLRPTTEYGPLFAPPPATAILGTNGSGKSTLIDALMIALLPFENSVRLGVTNDVEGGGAGGRTVRDYILGKHSSTGANQVENLEQVYGRKSGMSAIVLNFQHNHNANRRICLGRLWWFQNYKITDTQLAFVAFEKISISDLCPDSVVPKSPKAFRLDIKDRRPGLQIFETLQSYFTALSGSLGQISRDDLKILNRAFFVKSISQIDQFIRDNMLLEQDSPHLERLLENVRNGQEIALAIQTCEQKIAVIEKITSDLQRLVDIDLERRDLERNERLLSLLPDWIEIRQLTEQLGRIQKETDEANAQLPQLRLSLLAGQDQLAAAQAALAQNDLTARLRFIEAEVRRMGEQRQWLLARVENWRKAAAQVGFTLSADVEKWEPFLVDAGPQGRRFEEKREERRAQIEGTRRELYSLEAETAALQERLEHLSTSGTLIPQNLFKIRERAAKETKIPLHHLRFVGELLQVRGERQKWRREVEAALESIARQLLVHPDDFRTLTQWLNKNGLSETLVVRKIGLEELQSEAPDLAEASLLDAIEFLADGTHPFEAYLRMWLATSFDFTVVSLRDFLRGQTKGVTAEGLVHLDSQTIKKMKAGFDYSLGWDNQDIIAAVTEELMLAQGRQTSVIKRLAESEEDVRRLDRQLQFLAELQENIAEIQEIQGLPRLAQELANLGNERRRLETENPDYQNLKKEEVEYQARVSAQMREVAQMESRLNTQMELKRQIEGLLPLRTEALQNSLLFSALVEDLGTGPLVEQALESLRLRIEKKGKSRLQLEAELRERRERLDTQKTRLLSVVAGNLGHYRRTFGDPNLPYEWGADPQWSSFRVEWVAAEERLKKTDLPQAQEKWRKFFDQVLFESLRDMINEIKSKLHEIQKNIASINDVLRLTNFEDLPTEKRYLKIDIQTTQDERIRKFRRNTAEMEKLLGANIRTQIESQSENIMATLVPFVEELQGDVSYRNFVTDVRNHFRFQVHSLRRGRPELNEMDAIVETFTGARHDAKSSAQTTQLAYTLLASCLAYRFRFHDPVAGHETPRLLILDEFGGKFDNEKPRDVLRLLDKMGFQSLLVSPMSKADLLAENIGQLVMVHKVSASHSKCQSHAILSKDDYDRLIQAHTRPDVEVLPTTPGSQDSALLNAGSPG